MGRADEGDGFADRRVQTIKQLHVDRRGKRYRDSLRAPAVESEPSAAVLLYPSSVRTTLLAR